MRQQRFFGVQYKTKHSSTWRMGFSVEFSKEKPDAEYKAEYTMPIFPKRSAATSHAKFLRGLYKVNNKYGYRFRVVEMKVVEA